MAPPKGELFEPAAENLKQVNLVPSEDGVWHSSPQTRSTVANAVQVFDNGSGIYVSSTGKHFALISSEDDTFVPVEPVSFLAANDSTVAELASYGFSSKALEEISAASQYAKQNDLESARITIFVPANDDTLSPLSTRESVTTTTTYNGVTFTHRVVHFEKFPYEL